MIFKGILNTIQNNSVFFIPYMLLLLLGVYPLYAWDKLDLLILINTYHHPILDHCFYYITYLGNSLVYALLLVILFFSKVSRKTLFIGGVSFTAMSLIVQCLKRIIFPEQLRPIALVFDPTQLHLADPTNLLRELSFPSGHAATIFTAACFLNLIATNKQIRYSILLLLVALTVSYSRIYLCQHFYIDVYIGAVIGGFTTLLVYTWLTNWSAPHWLKKLFV